MKSKRILTLMLILCLSFTSVIASAEIPDPESIEAESVVEPDDALLIEADPIEPTVEALEDIELSLLPPEDEIQAAESEDAPFLDGEVMTEAFEPMAVSNKAVSGIAIDATNFPDANFCAYILNNCDMDKDGYLSDSEIDSVTRIDIAKQNIASVQGIEVFSSLTHLVCFSNDLTCLDLSSNTKLVRLDCDDNQLTNLNIKQNYKLHALLCYKNKLTELDISGCQRLVQYVTSGYHEQRGSRDCYYEDALGYETEEDFRGLECDTGVALVTGSTPSGVRIDSSTFPDAIFRAYISENFDTNHNGYLSDMEIAAVKTVDVGGMDITTMSGIQYLTALDTLDCSANKLHALLVSANPNLRYLYCDGNDIQYLDFSNNPKLVQYVQQEGVIKYNSTTSFVPVKARDDTDAYLRVDTNVLIHANGSALYDPTMTIIRKVDSATIGVKEQLSGIHIETDTPYWIRQLASKSGTKVKTSNKKIAKVDSSGIVIGVKQGNAKITVTTSDKIQITYTVNVKKAPSKITVSPKTMTLGVGEEKPLSVKLPKGTASNSIIRKSSNPDIADFDDYGNIHAHKSGSTTITVRAFNKKKATCKVTVLPRIKSVALPVSTLTLGVKQTYSLKPTLAPKVSGSNLYTFSSSNKKVISVTASGKLTAKKKGTAKITVK